MSYDSRQFLTKNQNFYHNDYLTFFHKGQEDSLDVSLPAIYDSENILVQKQNKGRKVYQIIAALIASITAFSAGNTIAWTAQISEKLLDGEDFPFAVTSDELGWIGSLMPLGASVLSLFTGTVSDLIGRKPTGLLLVLPAITGWSLIIWTKSITMLYIGRFITGMAAGGFCVFTSLYNHEIGQKEVRGAIGSFLQMMISCGILFAVVTAKFLSIQTYTILCGVVPIVFAVLFLFMPETPYYYIKTQKTSQARLALVKLRGPDYDIETEIKEIETYIKETSSRGGMQVVMQCLKKSSTKKACVIGFGLMIFKVANGVDAITAYTSYILTSVNLGFDSQTGTIILNCFQVASAIFQSYIVDKSGRRILLLVSSGVMTLCLLLVAISFTLTLRNVIEPEYYKYINYIPLVALVLFILGFSLGLGPIPWLMMGEVFPREIKSTASSLATFVSWIATFAVTKLFLVIKDNAGGDVAFYIFSCCTLTAMVFTLLLVPETKNKTYDEIQNSL
ncbi:hypothetical protein FQR65_LT06130 [Abscondita terminalis]|nr:hypothetical protein FQR65_LT06130 [Abscondita terminalis]